MTHNQPGLRNNISDIRYIFSNKINLFYRLTNKNDNS